MSKPARKTCDLKSSCPICGTRSTIRYSGGIENHKCKKCGCSWDKSAASTRAALPLGYSLAAPSTRADNQTKEP